MTDSNVPVILGTARVGRRSEAVASLVVNRIKQRGWLTDLIDVADYRLTATPSPVDRSDLDRYREQVAAADGLVIVAPEYNHGYPGELKLLLDSDYHGYSRKPVGLVGVSSGRLGGARMVEQLQAVTTALGLVPVSPAVLVPEVPSALDENGRFVSASLDDVLEAMLAEVEWYLQALTPARGRQR